MNFKHLLLIAGSLLLVVACASKKKSMEMDRSYPTSASPQEPMVGATADMEMADEALPPQQMPNTESYDKIVDNKFLPATSHPLSTFSIDVDTASYANLRRFLTSGVVPPKDAIRIEEMINYFPYDYTHPKGSSPLTVQVDAYSAPWKPEHHLVRVAIKGKELKKEEIKPSNLVFLLDVSGSMETPNKLPLLKRSFRKLVENLDGRDRVSIVAYAGASGVVLPPTSADNKTLILNALERLSAGGSTNGGQGLELAYNLAQQTFLRNGNNRIILATDGDFNVGITSRQELVKLIKRKADGGIYLSVLGFGMGNYKDDLVEQISNQGDGNYFYIDSLREAEKVLVNQLSATLFTIAKDVKIQVEFNPAYVNAYRLIGYENRLLAAEDFNDDRKDAGEIGAGFTVTALYEIIPSGIKGPNYPELKYSSKDQLKTVAGKKNGEILTVKMRYKKPTEHRSQLVERTLKGRIKDIKNASPDMRFVSAVAEFGMILRNSPYKGGASLEQVLARAKTATGHDDGGYRKEFTHLVERSLMLKDKIRR